MEKNILRHCKPHLIVDAGSGYTRIHKFHTHKHTSLVEKVALSRFSNVVEAISHDGEEEHEWHTKFGEIIAEHNDHEYFIGATAGVRDALHNGKIGRGDLAGNPVIYNLH